MAGDKAADISERLDDRIILLTIALSVIFFAVVNEVLRCVARRFTAQQVMLQWRWRNLAVSWIHADICAMWCFYCYYMYGRYIHSLTDLLDLRAPATYLFVSFSAGYFLYDLLNHVWEGQAVKAWEVVLHHITVIYIFAYNLGYHMCIAFSVLALMVEINSVFLHARKLLQMAGVPFSHWLYRVIVVLNLASFVVFRGAAMGLIWMGLVLYSEHFTTVYIVGLGTIMAFMVLLNGVLFWRLIKNDVLRGLGSGRKVKGKKSSGKIETNGIVGSVTVEQERVSSSSLHGQKEWVLVKNCSDDGKVANGLVSRNRRAKGREGSG